MEKIFIDFQEVYDKVRRTTKIPSISVIKNKKIYTRKGRDKERQIMKSLERTKINVKFSPFWVKKSPRSQKAIKIDLTFED